MPMPSKGARLYLRKRRGRRAIWFIRDTGKPERSTGTDCREEAEVVLAEYIARRSRAAGPVAADRMTIAEALTIYAEERAGLVADPVRISYALQALLPYWGPLPVSAVKGATCRRYAATREASAGTARKELSVLSAALRYCQAEGYLINSPRVPMPPRPETTQRALTRDEAAKLLRTARRLGQHHVVRFIIVALYSGTRRDAILRLRLDAPSMLGGWIDLEHSLLYRRGDAERVTKKRRSPAKLPRQLLGHARRWRALGLRWVVEWRGRHVTSIKTAWRRLVAEAGLGWHPTPHTLKHTAVTWAIQRGVSIADAAGYFSTSAATIERVYWHHSPHFQQSAVDALERRLR